MESEIWKPVSGFEEFYEVSNFGRVRSLPVVIHGKRNKRPARVLTSTVTKNTGYLKVTLSKYGKSYTRLVHRLVATEFLNNTLNLRYVNHKDGNKQNCHEHNLEWTTQSANINHAFRTGLSRRGEDHEWSKLTEDQVRAIRNSPHSSRIEAQKYGVSRTAIKSIRNFKTWKYVE